MQIVTPRWALQWSVVSLPKSIDRGAFTPRLYYMVAAMGDGQEPVTDRRYHDVNDAGMDETRDLLSQLRTVFSIVGK